MPKKVNPQRRWTDEKLDLIAEYIAEQDCSLTEASRALAGTVFGTTPTALRQAWWEYRGASPSSLQARFRRQAKERSATQQALERTGELFPPGPGETIRVPTTSPPTRTIAPERNGFDLVRALTELRDDLSTETARLTTLLGRVESVLAEAGLLQRWAQDTLALKTRLRVTLDEQGFVSGYDRR